MLGRIFSNKKIVSNNCIHEDTQMNPNCGKWLQLVENKIVLNTAGHKAYGIPERISTPADVTQNVYAGKTTTYTDNQTRIENKFFVRSNCTVMP